MSLAVWVFAAIEWTEAVLHVPQHVVDLPHAVQVVGGEEFCKVCILIEVCVHLEESHLHEVVVEVGLVDELFHNVGVLEEQLHQSAVAQTCGAVPVVGLLGFSVQRGTWQYGVLVVHVPLCALRGVHLDIELRVLDGQFQQGRLHRHDAAGNGGAAGRDAGRVSKNIGVAVDHASGNMTHLVLAERRQVAPAVFGVFEDDVHLLQYAFADGCQFVDGGSLHHHLIGNLVA